MQDLGVDPRLLAGLLITRMRVELPHAKHPEAEDHYPSLLFNIASEVY